jgi:CRISPR/Cas system-associated exonuclease Cas4 (RecB family)
MAAASPRTVKDVEQPFTFSQSSLQDYADCPRRFQLRYLERLAWPAVESEPASEVESRQRDAQLFHRLVQQHMLGLPDDLLAPLAASSDLRRWWQNFTSAGPDVSAHTLHTERSLVAPLGEHRLVAKYDLVAVREDEAVIYDWKTHARRPQDAALAARWQTRVYRAMMVKAGAELNGNSPFAPDRVSMIYWFAEFPSQPTRLPYDAHQFKRDWSAIESLASEIASAQEFPLTEDLRQCRFCTYRSLCDRGETAGAWLETDDQGTSGTDVSIDFEQIGEIEF